MGNKIPVNLYVRLNDEKFVLIAKTGQPTNREQLRSFNNKEVAYLWVAKSEFSRVAKQSITLAGIVVSKKDLDFSQKTSVVTAAARTVFSQLDYMGVNFEVYNNAKQITEATVAMCESHKSLATLFEGLKQCSDELLTHSMAVSILSVLVGQQMGWEKKMTLEKLSLGGMLHDIGKKTLPPELLKKPVAQMNSEEVSHYETHPFRGMQLLLSLGIVPDDIVSIVYEHHENSLGQGYPQRIRDVKIHPMAKVVGLVDQFINLTMENINCPNPKKPREAIVYMEHIMGQPFNKEAFRALKSLVEREGLKAA